MSVGAEAGGGKISTTFIPARSNDTLRVPGAVPTEDKGHEIRGRSDRLR
jgi:hypothetical protein